MTHHVLQSTNTNTNSQDIRDLSASTRRGCPRLLGATMSKGQGQDVQEDDPPPSVVMLPNDPPSTPPPTPLDDAIATKVCTNLTQSLTSVMVNLRRQSEIKKIQNLIGLLS